MTAMEVIGTGYLRTLDYAFSRGAKSQGGIFVCDLLILLQLPSFIQQDQQIYHFIRKIYASPIIDFYWHHPIGDVKCHFYCLRMSSCELSEGLSGDQWANFEESEDIEDTPVPLDLFAQYESAMRTTQMLVELDRISPEVLKHHRITITHYSNIADFFKVYQKDCYITIKKRHHFGTHCIYDVVLANFTLEIHLLNLHRSSDEEPNLSQNEVGKGGFGSVRAIRAGKDTVAVKRIDFVKKAKGVDGFDIETETAECRQIHKAIRQYCLYKICSMLKIGPEVLFESNYDLVCFSNCIEFIMELCQNPCKSIDFMSQRGLSVSKIEEDLLESLKLLHSLNIVHKDIKPDNILFSDSLQRFVLTDFGITHAVKEKINEKTLTSFAGTPEFCSQEMGQLINQGSGYVNLYLNDFEGLRKSIAKFQAESKSSTSLSHNAMSLNNLSGSVYECEEQQEAPASFEEWFQNEVSQGSSQKSENIYITSTQSMGAPAKYASQINFFQALILYRIFQLEHTQPSDLQLPQIKEIIRRYGDQIDNIQVEEEVRRYVLSIFFPSEFNSALTLRIVDLKNTARNFGPKHEETLQKIEEILAQIGGTEHPEFYEYFKSVRQAIIGDPECFEVSKFQKEGMIHIYLKNYNYFIGCCIRIMREAVKFKARMEEKNSPRHQSKYREYLPFLCKLYVLCHKLNAMTITENNTLNHLFLQLWRQGEVEDLHQLIRSEEEIHNYHNQYSFDLSPSNSRIVARMMRHAVNCIINSDEANSYKVIEAFNFLINKFSCTNYDDYNFYRSFISQLEERLANTQTQQCRARRYSLMVELVKIYRKICRMDNHLEEDKLSYIDKMKEIIEGLRLMEDKKYYFTCMTQLAWVYYETQLDLSLSTASQLLAQLEAYQCPQIEKRYAIVHTTHLIGSLHLLRLEYQEALEYLKATEQYILEYFGSQNLMESYYQCLSNISFTYYKLKQHEKALSSYQFIITYFDRTKKMICFQKSLVYRSILVIRLEMGVTSEDYPQIDHIIKKIVYQTIFTLVSLTPSDNELRRYILGLETFNFIDKSADLQVNIFVMKTLLKYIQNHLNYFSIPYDRINYQLNKIYSKQLNQPSKCFPFIWNYIKVKLQNFHRVTQEDFRLMNDFVSRLIKCNSSRRALIILKKYIFHLPLNMPDERQKAYKLFHKVHAILAHPLERVTYELVYNQCQNLYTKNFGRILKEEISESGRLKNILLRKWLSRV